MGCFFHYSQAIWRKAYKLSLRSEVFILGKTKILIGFLKILIHLPIIKRKEIVDALEKNYGEDKNYQKLINYFKKNWMESYYISEQDYTKANEINRTNNTSERYNFRLEEMFFKKLGIQNYMQNTLFAKQSPEHHI